MEMITYATALEHPETNNFHFPVRASCFSGRGVSPGGRPMQRSGARCRIAPGGRARLWRLQCLLRGAENRRTGVAKTSGLPLSQCSGRRFLRNLQWKTADRSLIAGKYPFAMMVTVACPWQPAGAGTCGHAVESNQVRDYELLDCAGSAGLHIMPNTAQPGACRGRRRERYSRVSWRPWWNYIRKRRRISVKRARWSPLITARR